MKFTHRHITALLFSLVFLTSVGQQVLLRGSIVEHGHGNGIPGVVVSLQGNNSITNEKGEFEIAYNSEERGEIVLTHIAFKNRTIRGPFKPGVQLVFKLKEDVALLGPAVVVANPTPEVVYESKTLHVAEFEVSSDGIWMLNYIKPRMFRREAEASLNIYDEVELVLLDTNMQVIDSENLPNGMLGMFKDHEGQIILKGKNGDVHAQYFNEHIILRDLPAGMADERLSWSDSLQGKLLGSNFIEQYPAFDHFSFAPEANESRLLYSVEDKPLMRLFRSEINYMNGKDRVLARNLEMATGIDKEVHAAFMSGFPNSMFFEPLYAPLFVVNDTILIMDHYEHVIRRYRSDLYEAGTVGIDYHLGKKGRSWDKEILNDVPKQKLYARYSKNARTWLECLNPNTGSLYGTKMLYYQFPEQVKVFDGHVYYVYREAGSTQKKTLYREPIQLNHRVRDDVLGSQTK